MWKNHLYLEGDVVKFIWLLLLKRLILQIWSKTFLNRYSIYGFKWSRKLYIFPFLEAKWRKNSAKLMSIVEDLKKKNKEKLKEGDQINTEDK